MPCLRRLESGDLTDVLLPITILQAIEQHGRSCTRSVERGGLLLGYRKPNALQLLSITFPTKWDRATATLFARSERGHRIRALREWKTSNGYVDWVGEWHTHPGSVAEPSGRDRRTWKDLARHTKKPMAFLILADAELYVGVQATPSSNVMQLSLREQDQGALLYTLRR
jgi:integrative and conjugative element protein (TIGR02256 family)